MLTGTRVVLSPFVPADRETLYSWIRDRDLMILSSPYRPVGWAEHCAWFERVQQRADVSIFGIRLRESDELIGSCQLSSIEPVHRTAELQVRIGPAERRGQGLGTEALGLLLDFAFGDLGLHRVQLHAFAGNAPALRVYQGLGFATEGTLREAAYLDGRRVDVVVMGLLASERRPPA